MVSSTSGARCGISITARPPICPGAGCGRGALVSKLFAHPLKDPFGDGQFIKLGPRHAGKIVTVVIEDTHFRILHGEDELAVRPRKNPGPITRLYVKGTGTQRDRQGSPDDKPSKKS